MHRKFFTVLALVVIFSMMTTGLVFAMPEPPENPSSTQTTRSGGQAAGMAPANSQEPGDDGKVEPYAIALGKPGLAFSYSKTFGTTGAAYYDGDFLNGVPALAIDDDDNIYAVEENGARLLKWNSSGVLQWKVGVAGLHDWGSTGLSWPRDVVIGPDGMLWVADSDTVARFDPANGKLLSRFPSEPWNAPDENRFHELRGIAFDSAGHLYLSDRWRNRVQVYTLGAGDPVYLATIEADFMEPGQIVIDSANNLYVDDTQNARVQKCVPNGTFDQWTCSIFYGGSWGGGENEMVMPWGLHIDDNGNIFMTDNGNGRVFKCSDPGTGMTCSVFVTDLFWPTDVVVASDGQVFISTYADYTIQRFSADGSNPAIFAGVSGTPYTTGVSNFNGPRAIDVDAAGNIYMAEEWGQRMFKLAASGSVLWMTGEPGQSGDDADHLNSPSALAVNSTRTKLIVVGGGSRVEWFNPANGAKVASPVNFTGEWGEGLYQFKQARGVAFDPLGNFYIADAENQRVMMYNAKGLFVRQLGVTNERGPANDHFNNPNGVATDASGNLYVADRDNCRVQKFSKTGVYLMTFGTTLCGSSVDRLAGPTDVAVDTSLRVYVLEEWGNSVKVFSNTGAYLATIAGGWGDNTSDMRSPGGMTVGPKSTVYVTDQGNARIQKYTLGVPYAAKISLDNFGQKDFSSAWALAYFKNQIYAGTNAQNGGGAQIWRKGTYGWEKIVADGFDDGANGAITHLFVYKGYLYAATYHCYGDNCSQSNGGQIWRSMDGLTWMPVVTDGFGSSNNQEIHRLSILAGKLCASTWTPPGGSAEIWCSPTGDAATWTRLVENGFGNPDNSAILSMVEFGGAQFAGTMNEATGAEIYRRVGDAPWQRINTTSFNAPDVTAIDALAVFKTYLYAATNHVEGAGLQVWRCKKCDGTDWQQVEANGFGDINNQRYSSLVANSTTLYAAAGNIVTGLEIWKTVDGLKWTRVSVDGLGSSSNARFYWNNGMIGVGSNLYLGVINFINGGSVWKVCPTSACK